MDRDESLDCEYNGPERRKHCEMVIQIKTMFLEDQKNRDIWRNDVDSKLAKILNFLNKIEGPYNAGLWAFRIAIGGVIITAVGWFFKTFNVVFKQ